MSCFHGYSFVDGCEDAFAIDSNAVAFGPGVLRELGATVAATGARRVALFSDRQVAELPSFARARDALARANLDVAPFLGVHIEPTDRALEEAIAFAREGRFDAYVSVGGGSVIDTCKIAALQATYPAPLLDYVAAPLGRGLAIPGPLPPHIACPTTAGTGSECTGIAIFDCVAQHTKTGIASRRLRPTQALVDPLCTETLPAEVVAAAGFDVLCHAIESYTARPYTRRAPPATPQLRPMSQGANPWSDLGSLEALRLGGQFLVRAVEDAADHEARHALAWAATLAGIAFGNAGVHLPHAMSYAVAGHAHDRGFRSPGYPVPEADDAFVPHGVSVVVNAPSVFRATAATNPARHLEAARLLGADTRGASEGDAGDLLATQLLHLMQRTRTPNGLAALGFLDRDVAVLARSASAQRRLLDNAPLPVDEASLAPLFAGALRYW